jgi:uncharacterized cupredoxin-like copper-binding protein
MRRALAATVVGTGSVLALTGSVVAAETATPQAKVTLKEFTLKVTPAAAKAGKVTFVVRNVGALEHEFEIVRWAKGPASLPLKGQRAKAPSGAELGEIEDIEPGQTKQITLTLAKGSYVLICNVPGHYKAGQRAAFRVN